MLVREVMQPRVVTVTPTTTLPDAIRLTNQRRIRHLPVIEDGELVGIVSDRDLKRAMASSATALEAHELTYLLNKLTVGEIMTGVVVTISPLAPVENAARLMVEERIGALPVLDGSRLVGIVTETDVLQLFVKAVGAGRDSSRLDIFLGGSPEGLGDAVTTVERAGAPVASVMVLTSSGGVRQAVVRIATLDAAAAVSALEARGYLVRQPGGEAAEPRRGIPGEATVSRP
jgi:acetoin utilization protein AcuB